jgi:hypothetical protein
LINQYLYICFES